MSTPKYSDIAEAIHALRIPGSTKGVSRVAIKNYLGGEGFTADGLNYAIKSMVAKGLIIQIKDSFKVSKATTGQKSCVRGKIRNQQSNYCVKRKSRLGKAIIAAQKQRPLYEAQPEQCSPTPAKNGPLIKNPATGRCVMEQGQLGRAITGNYGVPFRKAPSYLH